MFISDSGGINIFTQVFQFIFFEYFHFHATLYSEFTSCHWEILYFLVHLTALLSYFDFKVERGCIMATFTFDTSSTFCCYLCWPIST